MSIFVSEASAILEPGPASPLVEPEKAALAACDDHQRRVRAAQCDDA